MCFLLYTGGDESKLSCIARAACESPSEADNYLSAAKLWYKMSKLIKAVPFNTRYTSIMETVYDAAEHANAGPAPGADLDNAAGESHAALGAAPDDAAAASAAAAATRMPQDCHESERSKDIAAHDGLH